MIRVASIGYGDIAQRLRFHELKSEGDRAELVAIAGRDSAKLKACAERFDIPDTYTDVDAMLARDDIDAVLVLTPPDTHAEMAIKAIRAGKHVLLEKPMVMSIDEAHAIAEAVKENPVVFFPLPHVAATRLDVIKELVEAGAVGTVTSVEWHQGHRGPTHADWFYRKEIAGGGVLYDLGIYALGGIAYMFGPAAKVSALLATRFKTRTMDDGSVVEPNVEDVAMVNLWLEKDIAAYVHATFNGYLSHHHTRSTLVILGREGMLYSGGNAPIHLHRADDNYEGLPFETEPDEFEGRQGRRIIPPDDATARSPMDEFLHRIEQNDLSTTLLEQQIHVSEIMMAAVESGGLDDARSLSTRF